MEGDTNVFLLMNVTVIRNSDNLVNPKSGDLRVVGPCVFFMK